MNVLSSTFEKMVIHNSNRLKIIHDLLEYMDAFINKNTPAIENNRVETKVILNLTGYFLLKTIGDLDISIQRVSLNVENILNVIL